METLKTTINQRLINTLLLNSSFIDNLGLLNGKMGISILFYHLARETGNSIYEDYAGELIDEIHEEITVDTPLDFANGLAGIGWGIEYLVQNNFIEADTDEVLEEFDQRLSSLIYNFPASNGLSKGLAGVGAYLLKRIQKPNAGDEKLQALINKQHLIQVINEFDRRTQDVSAITREPVVEQLNRSDSGKAYHGNNKDRGRKVPVFDLIWDYPVLLVFLTEVFQLKLCNIKVNSILQRLILPMLETEHHPQLHSNRLLLALALTKLKHENINPLMNEHPDERITANEFISCAEIEKIIQRLLSGISREVIIRELIPNCPFLKGGTSGISWIYCQLFDLAGDHQFQTEANYWKRESFKIDETNKLIVLHGNEEQSSNLGILEGYAGLMFIHCCHGKD